jgi:3-oxoacyl-(acyl-carrier-protein) synthase
MPTFMQYAVVAAQEALNDAKWQPANPTDQEATVRTNGKLYSHYLFD